MKRIIKMAAYACLLWSTTFFATAGSFTPDEGSTITSDPVVVSWVSDAQNQWVRAYNSEGAKIFDSGRQIKSAGSVQFAVGNAETRVKIIFYEKAYGTGDWISVERLYPVEIDGSDDGGSTGGSASEDTLASLTCSTDQVARFNGSAWICSNDNDTDFLNEAGCAPGDLLRATDSEGWECMSGADVIMADDCPPLYSSELNTLDSLIEPSLDWDGNYTSIPKNVIDQESPGLYSKVCYVEWGNSIRHVFRRNYTPEDFPEFNTASNAYDFMVENNGFAYDIVAEYGQSSDEDGNPLLDGSNEKVFTMTKRQWSACGILAGCNADDF